MVDVNDTRFGVWFEVIARGYVGASYEKCVSGLGFCVGDAFVDIVSFRNETRRDEMR